MITDLCEYLKNYFDTNMPKRFSTFKIENGKLKDIEDMVSNDQYYRIIGSVFNDGVYKYGSEEDLTDEVFDGAVWAMAVPKRVETLSKDIDAWNEKYASVDSVSMSPYNSESFGGYSYSKSSGSSADGSDDPVSWEAKFKSRLSRWRKI